MRTSSRSDVVDRAGYCSTHRVYRERNTGTRVFVWFAMLLVAATVTLVKKEDKEPWWPWIIFLCVLATLSSGLFVVWREVTVDAPAQVTREAWRLFGVLTVWRRQRSLREFASVRSQRVEVVTKGNRRVVCDVYLVAGPGAAKRLEVERVEMGEAGDCPEGIAIARDLAQLTGLPFEDKC